MKISQGDVNLWVAEEDAMPVYTMLFLYVDRFGPQVFTDEDVVAAQARLNVGEFIGLEVEGNVDGTNKYSVCFREETDGEKAVRKEWEA
jgi:hypothetical protein